MVKSNENAKIIAISVDAMTGEFLSHYVDKNSSIYPDIIADSASYFDAIMHFLDSNFVRKKIESMSGKYVHMMQFMSCGGVYSYMDCLSTTLYFWLIHFKTGESYIFYFAGTKGWKLIPVTQEKQENFNNF